MTEIDGWDSERDWEERNSQETDWSTGAFLLTVLLVDGVEEDDEIHLTRVQSWSRDIDDPELRLFTIWILS